MLLRPGLLFFALVTAHAGAQTPAGLGALTLRQAENMMLERNRELIGARRAVSAARADTLVAGAAPNPQLSLAGTNINPSRGIGAGGPRDKTVDTVIRIDQLIERGGKRELRIDAARKLELATGAMLDDTLRQQRLGVASAYYDLALAQEKLAIVEENAALFGRTLDATEQRRKAGDVAAADVSRIGVDALRAQNDARAAQSDLVRAQLALGFLIGAESEAQGLRAADPWLALDAAVARIVSDELLDRRPDVMAAKTRVEAALAQRELARRLRTRDVSVGVQFEHFPVGPSNDLGTGNSWGVGVSIPIFARYYYEGEIARAESELAATEENLEKVRAQARTELAQSASDVRSAADRLRRYESSLLVEAKKSADYAEFAYKNGAIGVLDLLDGRRTLRAVQLEAAVARADYAKALAAWRASAYV
jgi:cobalt-zinc-cadmium efflux system outer membrane protein